ncbi:ABC transporter ATP-binding protein [Micropruina sp.]|uniref:ABC transporter ATP-binding protein n=1 Tax=Micropruina sp. TaxID=2737536 RepID=UPI0039E6AA39
MPEQRLLAAAPDESRLLRRAGPLLRGHRLSLALAGTVTVGASAAEVGALAALGLVTDAVLAADAAGVVTGAALFSGLVLAGFGLGWLAQWLVVMVGERFVRRLRDDAVAALARTSVRFVEAHPSGELVRRLTGEIAGLSAFVGGTLPELAGVLVTLGLTFVMLAGYSWQLTAVLIVLVLAGSTLLMRGFLRRAEPAYAATANAEAQVSATFSESLPAREQLVVLGATPRRLARFAADNEALLRARITEVHTDRWLAGLEPVQGIVLVALVLLSYAATTAGWLGVGGVVVFLAACRQVFGNVQELVAGLGEWRSAKTTLARVLDLLDASDEFAPPAFAAADARRAAGGRPTTRDGHCRPGDGRPEAADERPAAGDERPAAGDGRPAAGELVATEVGYHYVADRPALTDVSLRVRPGERVALVGATGSGKTTLGKVLAGLYPPDAGRLSYSDRPLADFDEAELRRRIVLVPQEVLLVRGTLADNLALTPGVNDDPAGREQMLSTARVLGLDRWLAEQPEGLDTHVGEQGESLSAGERQLVALLRAVLADPAVLVLDEATADVDPVTAARVENALARAGSGRAVVVIAHRPDTVARADRVIKLEAGRVVG